MHGCVQKKRKKKEEKKNKKRGKDFRLDYAESFAISSLIGLPPAWTDVEEKKEIHSFLAGDGLVLGQGKRIQSFLVAFFTVCWPLVGRVNIYERPELDFQRFIALFSLRETLKRTR